MKLGSDSKRVQRVDLPKRLLARYRELPRELRGQSVFLAVSGGMDSTVLAAVAIQLRSELPPLHFLHVNYHLRVPDSDQEEASLRGWAKREGLPIHVLRLFPKGKPANLQAWARERRLDFFRKVIGKQAGGRGLIWAAHHQGDQAETVLVRLLRGAGLKGLRGMDLLEDIEGMRIFRPFLGVPREALQAYAEGHRICFHHDRSNDGDDYLRNRIRHRVLPLLREENPRVLEVLVNLADRAGEAASALQELALSWLGRAATKGGLIPATLRIEALRRQPMALRAAILENWIRLKTGREQSTGKILPPLLAAVEDPAKRLDLPLKGGYRLSLNPRGLSLRRFRPDS